MSDKHREQLDQTHGENSGGDASADHVSVGAEPGPPGTGFVGAGQHRGRQRGLQGDAARERGPLADISVATAAPGEEIVYK